MVLCGVELRRTLDAVRFEGACEERVDDGRGWFRFV
jgi:hypothetical protein